MKHSLLLLSFVSCFIFVKAQSPYTGIIATTDPVFNRSNEGIPPTTLSTLYPNTHYDVIPIVISAPGLVSFVCTGPAYFDTFGMLYSPAGFNPLSPLTNIVVGDDDGSGGVNFNKFSFTYDAPVAGTYFLVVTTFKPNNFGPYSVSVAEGGVLPVRLISFTAEKASAGKNLLKWVSAGESDILKYQIQHSNDGNTYTDIAGAIVDARNVSTDSYYNFTDNAPLEKLNYYRLKIIDKRGGISYSIIEVVNNGRNNFSGSLTVFPNPAVNFINIKTRADQRGKAFVSITSAAGQIIYGGDRTIANESILNFDVKKFSAGNYFVRIKTANGTVTTLPFVKH